ncbi:hydrophobe/amphiphile efflux-3 (HAE3) family transporter [Paenibacillus sp. FSL W8-0194]|uniref:efflux RND transporter permease subunit n=1 Tax=Paenibacillus sp. FSL W8-0194 TaxID=2921711 RepID=UPI0030D81890
MFKNASDSIGKWISKYAVWVIVVVLILTGVMGYGLSQIEIRTSVNMLLSDEDPVAVNNTRFQEKFGGESLILLVQGQKSQLFDSHSLNILNDLQTKLSGVDKVYSVTSPMSLAEAFAEQANKQSEQMEQQIAGAIKEAAGQAAAKAKESGGDEAAQADAVEQAKARVMQGVQEKYGKQLSQMEAIGDLSVSNDKFVRYALLDENGLPQPTVAQLLPEDGNNMLFQIQLDSGLTMQEMATATDEIEQIIADHKITETKTLFSGIPAISKTLEDYISKDIVTMLLTVIVLMIVVLVLVFPVRSRLLSLPIILVGMIWTFGLMGYMGMPLSIATMALLPILIGLGTDFALQFHNRYEEEAVKSGDVLKATKNTVSHMGPAVGIAVIIMAVGFLTLLFSDMPMIKDFGLMLAIGVVIMYVMGLALLLPVLVVRDRKGIRSKQRASGGVVERGLAALAKSVVRKPVWFLIPPVLIAGIGFGLDHKLNVESNIEKLMPQDAPALLAMNEIREVLGSTMTIDWMIESEDVRNPEVLQWINKFQKDSVEKYAEIEDASSIVNVLTALQSDILAADQKTIEGVYSQVPETMTSPFVSADHRMARVTFTLSDIDTKAQEKLLAKLEANLDAPDGVEVHPVGIQVLQVKSLNGLTDSRHTSLISGLLAILIGLFVVYRNLKRAFFPLLPIILVNGWSVALLYVLGIAINPLTAVLGALVLGIGTEFTILLMERYLEEKANGLTTEQAITTAMTKVGRAISASGLTVVGGFSALIFTNFEVVRVFGISTVLDTLLCLISTLTVLPAIIVLVDKDKAMLRTLSHESNNSDLVK